LLVVSANISFDKHGGSCFAGSQSQQKPPNKAFPNADLFTHTASATPFTLSNPSTPSADPKTFKVFAHPDVDKLSDPNAIIPSPETIDRNQFDFRPFIVYDAQT
jgi:hypothetical protein